MKRPFNTYTNRKGQTIPKSATIQTSPEILTWLKENLPFAYANAGKLIDETKPYILIGISASNAGYIYTHISTCDEHEISMYDPNMVKDFTNDEAFKKYLHWASRYPQIFVYRKYDKYDNR